MMKKPLATLGDVMEGLDWRAQLRAADVDRRQSPQSRPDRGFVEQPEERIETTQVRRRVVEATSLPRPPVPLLKFDDHPELLEELTRPDPKPAANDTPPKPPAPEKQTMNPPNETRAGKDEQMLAAIQREIDRPMAKKRGKYVVANDEEKLKAVKDVLERGKSRIEVANRLGVSGSSVSLWVDRYQATGSVPGKMGAHSKITVPPRRPQTQKAERTLVSGSGGPPSAVVSVKTSIRNGTRTFEQVSAELNAKLAEVAELKRELRDMLTDN